MGRVTHLDQRRIEAEMIGRLYEKICEFLDQDAALQIVSRTLEDAAKQEGQQFAVEAKPDPGLGHFKSIRDFWGDALQVEVVEDDERTFRFDVVRCKYIEAYRDLGLPPELVRILSCSRDAPFASSYSTQLQFSRASTLADGAKACDFCYRWS